MGEARRHFLSNPSHLPVTPRKQGPVPEVDFCPRWVNLHNQLQGFQFFFQFQSLQQNQQTILQLENLHCHSVQSWTNIIPQLDMTTSRMPPSVWIHWLDSHSPSFLSQLTTDSIPQIHRVDASFSLFSAGEETDSRMELGSVQWTPMAFENGGYIHVGK